MYDLYDLLVVLAVTLVLTYTFSGIIIVSNFIVYKFPKKITIWHIIVLILYLPVTILTLIVSAIVFFVNWIKDKRNKSNAGVRLSRRLF
jgi:hypothetical protein